ncbi:hypothetical protein AMTRI_Chr07g28640 [Amborella trichopoda]
MIRDYSETHVQKRYIGIHKEMIGLVKMYNKDYIHIISHFSTKIISFAILSVQEFFYNLSDAIKAFSILLLIDSCIRFNSPHGWELMIGSVYKDLGFSHNVQIISGLVFAFSFIIYTIFQSRIFHHLIVYLFHL